MTPRQELIHPPVEGHLVLFQCRVTVATASVGVLTVAFLLSVSLGMDLSIGQGSWLRLRLGEQCWPLPVLRSHTAPCGCLSSTSLLLIGGLRPFNLIPTGVHRDPVVLARISLRTDTAQYLSLAVFIVLLGVIFCPMCCCRVFFT